MLRASRRALSVCTLQQLHAGFVMITESLRPLQVSLYYHMTVTLRQIEGEPGWGLKPDLICTYLVRANKRFFYRSPGEATDHVDLTVAVCAADLSATTAVKYE